MTPELREKLKPAVPFKADGYNRFLDSKKMPAIAPPWGTLSAIDLNTGEYRWQVPLGDWGIDPGKPTGAENYGGPVVTASGLLFIAAARDEKIRAFDTKTGKVLWEAHLPAGGYATPATYAVNGKQYVVIACGAGRWGRGRAMPGWRLPYLESRVAARNFLRANPFQNPSKKRRNADHLKSNSHFGQKFA